MARRLRGTLEENRREGAPLRSSALWIGKKATASASGLPFHQTRRKSAPAAQSKLIISTLALIFRIPGIAAHAIGSSVSLRTQAYDDLAFGSAPARSSMRTARTSSFRMATIKR